MYKRRLLALLRIVRGSAESKPTWETVPGLPAYSSCFPPQKAHREQMMWHVIYPYILMTFLVRARSEFRLR